MTWQNPQQVPLLLPVLRALQWMSCLAAAPPGRALPAEVCRAKGMAAGWEESRLLSTALGLTSGFAVTPSVKRGKWVCVTPLGIMAVLSASFLYTWSICATSLLSDGFCP